MSKILIIDDDKKHSELLQAYMKRFGLNLVCAYDSVEGFKLLKREQPDLLLLDIMLPGKDGFEICREVRKTSTIPNWWRVSRRRCGGPKPRALQLAR